MGFFSGIVKAVGSVVKSPITKTVAGGLAVVFPPVGVPAAAAVASANMALSYAESPQGKTVVGAADKLVAQKKKAAVKVQLLSAAKKQIKSGVSKDVAKARMLVAARRIAPKLQAKAKPAATSRAVAIAAQNRKKLALQLSNTKKLAAQGDKGAQRALATFRLVAKARKGDPQARKAVALVAHRWEVGQRVRSRFELTHHGRIRARV